MKPPRQMTIDECIEVAATGSDGKPPVMTEPTRASEVQAVDALTPEERHKANLQAAVAKRIARRTALKRAGADLPPSSPTLADDLEARLRKRTGLPPR